MRYAGKPGAFLRGFRAIYLGLLVNCVILGWVTKAMTTIAAVVLGISDRSALALCVFFLIPFTGIYVALGGLWGVLWTDCFSSSSRWVSSSRSHGMASLPRVACTRFSRKSMLSMPQPDRRVKSHFLLSGFFPRLRERIPLDNSRHHLLRLSRRAMVGFLVSGIRSRAAAVTSHSES